MLPLKQKVTFVGRVMYTDSILDTECRATSVKHTSLPEGATIHYIICKSALHELLRAEDMKEVITINF